MATLREKLDAAVALQRSEVDRLTVTSKDDLKKAQDCLSTMQKLQKQLDAHPEMEAAFSTLKACGVKLDTES